MQRVVRIAFAIGSVMLLCAAVACNRGTPGAPSAVPATSAKQKVLRVHLAAEPEFLDPTLTSEAEGSAVLINVFDGLVRYDPRDNTPLPGLAERWDISSDGRVYTFHLRPNLVWSDGTPLTAHDVVFSWQRLITPATAAKYVHGLYPVKNAKAYSQGSLTDINHVGLAAPNNQTFVVTLDHPTPYFLQLIRYPAFAPVPRHIVTQFGNTWTRSENIVSSGPFVLTHHEPHKHIRLAKNPRYWDAAAVRLSHIDFLVVESLDTAVKMYEAGELDFVRKIIDQRLPQLKGRADFHLEPYLSSYQLWLNVTRGPLADVRVRRALAMAIDREQLCTTILGGTKIPKSQLVPPLPGYPAVTGVPFDPEHARALLAQAGYADPNRFPRLHLQYNTDERHRTVAQVVQQMWKQNLGITIELTNVEWKTHLKMLQLKDYDIGRLGWGADYADPNAFLEIALPTSELNYAGWRDTQFDSLMTQAATESGATRMHTLARAEARLLEEMPIISLYQDAVGHLIRPTVQGIYKNAEDRHTFRDVTME